MFDFYQKVKMKKRQLRHSFMTLLSLEMFLRRWNRFKNHLVWKINGLITASMCVCVMCGHTLHSHMVQESFFHRSPSVRSRPSLSVQSVLLRRASSLLICKDKKRTQEKQIICGYMWNIWNKSHVKKHNNQGPKTRRQSQDAGPHPEELTVRLTC